MRKKVFGILRPYGPTFGRVITKGEWRVLEGCMGSQLIESNHGRDLRGAAPAYASHTPPKESDAGSQT